MGRRRKTRKRVLLKPKKKLPKVFTCPACGTGIVNVVTDKKSGQVRVKCGSCGLEATFPIMRKRMLNANNGLMNMMDAINPST